MQTDRKFKSWMDRKKRTEKGDIRWPEIVIEKVRDRDKRGKAWKMGEEEKEEKLTWADLLSPKFFSARPPECSVNNWVVSYDSHLTSGSSIVRSSDVVGKRRGRREREREKNRGEGTWKEVSSVGYWAFWTVGFRMMKWQKTLWHQRKTVDHGKCNLWRNCLIMNVHADVVLKIQKNSKK